MIEEKMITQTLEKPTETKQVLGHLVNGTIVNYDNSCLDVFNPAYGTISKHVEVGGRSAVEAVISASVNALPSWSQTPPIKRARVMFKFKELLEKNTDKICRLIGEEHGKILHDAKGELQRGIENVEFACAAPELLKGEHNKNVGASIDCWSEFSPVGIVAGITPFNFPAMIPLWMYPLAIACGNCFVLKPSEKDPSSTMFIAELLHKAGLPDGVLNVINGNEKTAQMLLEDKRISAVSFVGSTKVARSVYAAAVKHEKRCQALGGAKNHAVVMHDCDLDSVVNQLLGAAFGSSGQRCMAISVAVIVGNDLATKFIEKMKKATSELKVGLFNNPNNDFGPLVTETHKKKIEALIASAERDGAKIVLDGRGLKVSGGLEEGSFLGPTLIDNTEPWMESYKEEIFGPVLQVVRVKNLSQAIDVINDNDYGNGACIFTGDGNSARIFSEKAGAGMIGINVPLPVPAASQSFGGWKDSLFGDLHIYGPDGVRFYTKRKTISQKWPGSDRRETRQFSMPSND